MAFFRNLFVALLSFILIIILSLTIIGLSLNLLLSPSVYEKAISESGAFDLLDDFESKGGTGFLQAFSDNSSREMGKEASQKFLSYLRGEIGEDEVTITLNSSKIAAFYEERARNFSVCKRGEQPYSGDKVICRPPERNSSDFLKEVLAKKNISLSPNPGSEVKLFDVMDKDGKIRKLRDSVAMFQKGVYASLLVSILIILLIVLIERKNLKAMERLLGADLLLTGALLFAAVFGGFYALSLIPPMKSPVLDKLLSLVASPILERIGFFAFVIFLVACALLIISFLSGKKQEKPKNK